MNGADAWTPVRPEDLSIHGLTAGIAALAGLVLLLFGVVSLAFPGDQTNALIVGAGLTFFGGLGAYQSCTPTLETTCDQCGDAVRVHSSRDGVDEVVEVRGAGSPARLEAGDLSLVRRRQRKTFEYCSPDCAHRHERAYLSTLDAEEIGAATPEVDHAD
jgi:hypothetical protein